MKIGLVAVLSAVAVGSTLAVLSPPVLAATSKECKAAFAAHRDEAKAAGQSEKVYIATCMGAQDVAGPRATAAAPQASAASKRPARDEIGKACEADFKANKAAVTDRGESKDDFLASCRAGLEASQTNATPEPAAPSSESATK